MLWALAAPLFCWLVWEKDNLDDACGAMVYVQQVKCPEGESKLHCDVVRTSPVDMSALL